ncbi:hypothetical protein BASA81_005158 [Batrachochytrium salamandrivorans]|nr:hypothetical protein BASA81_005158 [Batrachochytrium salamandrivorans]
METTYVCTYFNYYNNPLRAKLTQEFCDRYPWVTLLQATYGEEYDIRSDNCVRYKLADEKGFIDYLLINHFLKTHRMANLVILDSDLVLEDDFRAKMEEALLINDIVHGFNESYELVDGQMSNVLVPSYYINGVGHTGYVYGFSARFLERIDNKFMSQFLIGGFDYVLARIVTGKSLEPFSKFVFYQQLLDFAARIKGLKHTYLEHTVLHCYHGPKYKRLTPFKAYEIGIYNDWFKVRSG